MPHMFAAQVDGLLTALAVREDSVFMSMPVQDLVDLYAQLFQQALTRGGELASDTGQ